MGALRIRMALKSLDLHNLWGKVSARIAPIGSLSVPKLFSSEKSDEHRIFKTDLAPRTHSVRAFARTVVLSPFAMMMSIPSVGAGFGSVRAHPKFSPLSADDVINHLSEKKSNVEVSASLMVCAQKCVMETAASWESGTEKTGPAHQLALPYLKSPYIPMIVRAMLLEMISATVWHSEGLDQILAALMQDGGRVDVIADRIRKLYRIYVPHADHALALMDRYAFEKSVEFRTMGGPLSMEEVGSSIALRRALSPIMGLSLLLQPDKAVAWIKGHLRLITPRGWEAKTYVKVMSPILDRSDLTSETKVMLFDLIYNNYAIVGLLKTVLPVGVRLDPDAVAVKVRDLYVANRSVAEVILADIERCLHLPKERVKAVWAEVEKDKSLAKQWRTLLFKITPSKLDTALQTIVDRALMSADAGDIAQQMTLMNRWIDALAKNFRITSDQVKNYDQSKDVTGRRALIILNEASYDPVNDPLGFLLPHERQFLEKPLTPDHHSIWLLQQIARTVRRDPTDIMNRYLTLFEAGSTDRAMATLRQGIAGTLPDVEPAHVRELMRRAVTGPLSHITLLYWASSMPSRSAELGAWTKVPGKAAALLQEARDVGADVVGNVMELVMRGSDSDAMAEMEGVRHSLQRGNWIYILPRDFEHFQPVADMLVIDEHGMQDAVEIKHFRYNVVQDVVHLQDSLDRAVKQLDSSKKTYPNARPVIYVRVSFDARNGKPLLIRELIEHRLSTDHYRSVAEVVVTMETGVETIANPNYSDRARVTASLTVAGLRLAKVIAERMVHLGMADPVYQNAMIAQLSQAPKDNVAMVSETVSVSSRLREALDRYSLLPLVARYLTADGVKP